MPKLKHSIWGIQDGNFSSNPQIQSQEQFLASIEAARIKKDLPSGMVFFRPDADFTTEIAEFEKDRQEVGTGFYTTTHPADGALVYGFRTAVTVVNGDCPTICLWEDNKLIVLHGGYRCLIRANKEEDGLIERALKHFDPHRVQAFIFGGIGPCCWSPSVEKYPEIVNTERSRYPHLLAYDCRYKTTEKSPWGHGCLSIDLYHLARGILWELGVPEKNFSWDTTCTCHTKKNGEYLFWSHTRFKAQEKNGKNS